MRLSSEILISESALRSRVEAMAAAITADTPEGTTLSVIALMDGAFVFCADLVRRLPMPIRLALVPMVSIERGGDPRNVPLPFPMRGADVLVVEDILDTGVTLAYLSEQLSLHAPKSLKICTFLDKPHRRKVDLTPDFVGFEVPDRHVVGYGLDFQGKHRNLPHLTWVE